MKKVFWLVCVFIVILFASEACVSSAQLDEEEMAALVEAARMMRESGVVQLNLSNMDIVKFMLFMSELIDKNIVIAPDVKGKVTIISPHPMTISEAYEMMLSVLDTHNLYIKDAGSFLVVKRKAAISSTPPNEYSTDITERLGITSADVIEAMKHTGTLKALKDATSLLLAVLDNQPEAKKITHLIIETTGKSVAAMSYHYEIVSEDMPSLIVQAASSDVRRGQVPVSLLAEFADAPFNELRRIRALPNDRVGGLEIRWIQNNSLLKMLGIRRGDVINSVNGILWNSLKDIDEIIHELLKMEHLELGLTRGQQSIILDYDVVSDDFIIITPKRSDYVTEIIP